MAEIGADWRWLDGAATAWLDAPSVTQAAALAGRIVELSPETAVDLRNTGVGVRLGSDDHAEAVSAAARDLGLAANPAALQQLSVVIETANPAAGSTFWQRVLAYPPGRNGGVADPLRRLNPVLVFQQLDVEETQRRRQRNRIHVERAVPSDLAETRCAAVVGAGGRLLDESEVRWGAGREADPRTGSCGLPTRVRAGPYQAGAATRTS